MSSKARGLIWVAAAIVIAIVLAGGLNFVVNFLPRSAEAKIAARLPEIGSPCAAAGDAALDRLRARLAVPGDDRLGIHLHLIRADAVNAFAFLGGAVYVNSGLLRDARNADEVAGVVAHEISHVQHRDVLHAISGQLVTALLLSQLGDVSPLTKIFTRVANLKFTRAQEEAADRGAMARLQAAHVSARPLAEFFRRLESAGGPTAFLSDHPDSDARAAMAESTEVEDATPALSEADWKSLKGACRAKE